MAKSASVDGSGTVLAAKDSAAKSRAATVPSVMLNEAKVMVEKSVPAPAETYRNCRGIALARSNISQKSSVPAIALKRPDTAPPMTSVVPKNGERDPNSSSTYA